ncbi:hypothetical protein ABR37_12000 [Enterobacter hormaechei subsp. hoffmannii]|uniref:BapA/Bap/LapF family large adhesin n=1 Tax=Enterobacter hormaechei TaxID=158836 RepID=UPI0006435CC5|nr:Ig-like domain repeat protein [Enterobacter hormaechei]KLP92994.1 hypothetical protein ABR37_12000 [Enterobacter hormaechei subsp. hoffmannii]
MSQISVISKLTGVETTTEGTQITLDHSSIVKLNVDRANIADYSRSGNDLVITLNSGEVITLKNFYVTDAQGVSQLVLEESDGALWWIEDPTGAATYESIASTDALLAASGSDAGGAAAWPWVLGGLAAAGGIAIAAGTGGGGGGDDDNNNPNPGNPGNPSEPDTTPPNAPTNLQVSPDGKTVTGTAEPGSTITLKDADGNTIGTGKVGSDGKFTNDLGTPLTNGEQITATATDPSGNTSQGGQVTAPDLTAPDAPANLEVSPDGKTVSGTAEPGSTVTLKDADGNTIGTGKAGSDGKFTIDLGTPLTNGEQITATATDPSGNTSPGVQVTAPDSTAPAAPEIVTVNDNVGTEAGPLSNGQHTDDARPTFSGISEAGTVITFYDNGKPIGTATADATGKWSFTPSTNLSEGNHAITTTATDAAGNQSGLSQPINFTVDLTPPDMPEATLNSTGTQITGTAEPGSKIVITNNAGVQIGTATADSNGNYVANLNPAQVNGEIISVVASDAAGNQSSPALVNAADITAPAAPGNLVVAEDGASVSGTAEPNSTIIIKAPDGTIIGQATAGPDGTFTIPISPAQTNGEALEVTATDGSGNTSPSGFADAPDSTPPLAPENVVISADGTTVTGTAEPGSTVTIRENGIKVGEAVADDQGNFSVDLIPPKANGEALTADATDTAGNTGPTAPFDAPDITAAQTPVITGVEDDALDVTGPVSQNGLTNDKTPTINGTGEPGTTITLYSGTTEIGTAVVGPDGQWSITLETDLPDGGHVLTATAVDANNNLSGTSNTWSITVDTAAPGAPAITQVIDDVPGRTGPLDNNQITNDTLPTLNGTGEPGSTVTIRLDGQDIGTAIVNNGGAWTFTPTTALGNGQHTFTVVASDAAGNTSASSPGFTFTVDTTPPPAATLDTVSDNIGTVQVPLNSGDTTDDTLPQLQGTAPEGTTITIYDGTTLLGTAVLDGSGGWSFTPTTPLTDGPHSLTVHATDEAGNTTISPPFELAIDTTAPATPDIPEITVNPDGATPGTALNPGETTRDTTPTLSGSGTPGDTVSIYDGATKIGEAEIDGDGNWSWTPEDPLPDGTYDLSLTVTNQDSAGNESAPSTPVTITIDTDAPGQPGIPTVTDSVSQITGPVDNGGTTNDPRPVLSGTGTPNDVITIYDQVGTGEPQAVGSVTVDGSGNWSWRPESNIGEGTHQYTATATDEAGNESLPSTGITITVDTLAPDTPLIGSIGGAQNGGSTNDNTPVIGGGGTTGETVIIYNNGVEVDRVEIANGEWSYTLPTQTDGPLNITVAAVDDAGNLSPVSPVFSVTVDTQAPTVPQIDAVSDNQLTNSVLYTRDGTPTLTGIGEPGSSVTVSVDGTPSPVVVVVQPNGTWSWTADPALAEGPHTFSVAASDAAGNTSASSGDLSVTVDTLLPATPTNITIAAEGTPLTGTADDGTTVTVRDAGGNIIGTGVATGGTFSIALSPAQLDPATLTLFATDAAGNASPTTTFDVPDSPLILPAVPVITAINDDADPVTGDVKDKTTNDTTPTLTGTADPGSVITIYLDGALVPLTEIVADTDGNWSYTPLLPLAEGPHTFAVTATNTTTGATSGQSPIATVTVDLTDPTAPAIGAVTDDVGPVTGPIADGQSTNDNRPTLTGTGTAGDTITVYDDGDPLGTVVVGPTGTWSYTPPALDDGSHTLTVTATDPAGNESAPSAGITIVVDTVSTTPVITSVTDNAGNAATPVPSGDPTNDTTPTLTGSAEPNSVVAIFDGATQIGTVAADGTGAWTFTPETALGEGTHDFTVRATDPQGNVSQPSNAWSVEIDLTAPQVPTIVTVSDNAPGGATGPLTAGQVTNDTTPTLSGTAQPNATITLYNNGVLMGTVTANASGNWSFTTPVLSEGPHAFTATATNGSGTSPISTSTTVIVDLTAPTAPTGTFNADGSVLTGSAEAGSTVTIRLADNSTVTATADSNGSWSYTFLNKQTEGQTLQITATDAAGNVSLPGSALAPVVPLSASTNAEELALTTTATVTNSQYSDYGFLLVGALGNVLTLLGNDTAQVGFTVGNGGSADIAVNANATGAVLSLLNTLELVVQRFDAANNTWTTVVDTGQPQFADLLTLGATGVSLNLTGLANGQYRVLSYNTNLLATGSYTSLDVAVKETSAGTVSGETSVVGNVITDVDPTAGSDNAPAGTTVTTVTNAQGTTTSVTADGTVIQGQYGTLTINLDGSYTYNLTNTSAAVIGRTENFTYTITHNGTSASANLVLSLGEGTTSSGIVAVDDTASLTFDTTVEAINNGTSSQGGFTLVGINLGNTLGLNLLDDLANPIIYNVEEGTTRTMTVQASVGGVALASVFDLYIYKFNNATQTFEQMRVEPGWLRAPLLGGTSPQLTLNLPAGEYLFLLNTAAGITALTAYTLNVLQDHVYSVASVSESTTGDVLADDIAPAGTVVSDVNGVAVNSSGLTEITGEYGTLRINAAGEYTYTLDSGVGADSISTPDTFVYTITAPNGSKDTASLNITPTAQPMDAVNDVSTAMDVNSVHRTAAYSDTTVGSASWNAALLASTQGSGSGTFVVDPNTALHNVVLSFNVASLLTLTGLTVDWTLTNGTTTLRSGSFNGGLLLGGRATINLTGLDLEAGTYTLNYTGRMGPLGVGNITVTPSVTGTSYSLSQFDATGTHTVDGNIFDGTGSAGAMDQLHSVDTRLSITGYDGVTTTLDPYTGSTQVNITGHYGTLAIAADGSYTYTLNPGISFSTITSKEVFNYTLTDANGTRDTASLTINMAPKFVSSEHNDVISGTAYGDTLIYQVLNTTAGNATAGNSTGDHWTNFSLSQGDKIDIGDLLVGWNGSASTLGNYVSVSQSGNNTVISIDRDGTGAAYTKSTLVTLDNVQTTYDELVNQQHIIT